MRISDGSSDVCSSDLSKIGNIGMDTTGAVIVISSHVVRGSVGNRAAVFGLETLGLPVWALPTIVLPWRPGHGPATRLTFPEADFDNAIGRESCRERV